MNEIYIKIGNYIGPLDFYADEVNNETVAERMMDYAHAKLENGDPDAEQVLAAVENEFYEWSTTKQEINVR